jgi:Ca2+-transporting ATPase
VVRTGADSGLGRIAALVSSSGLRATPLQQRLARLSRQLVIVTTLGLAQLGLALALRAPRTGVRWTERFLELSVLAAAALQVAAITWPPLSQVLGTTALAPTAWAASLALAALPGLVVGVRSRPAATSRR